MINDDGGGGGGKSGNFFFFFFLKNSCDIFLKSLFYKLIKKYVLVLFCCLDI